MESLFELRVRGVQSHAEDYRVLRQVNPLTPIIDNETLGLHVAAPRFEEWDAFLNTHPSETSHVLYASHARAKAQRDAIQRLSDALDARREDVEKRQSAFLARQKMHEDYYSKKVSSLTFREWKKTQPRDEQQLDTRVNAIIAASKDAGADNVDAGVVYKRLLMADVGPEIEQLSARLREMRETREEVAESEAREARKARKKAAQRMLSHPQYIFNSKLHRSLRLVSSVKERRFALDVLKLGETYKSLTRAAQRDDGETLKNLPLNAETPEEIDESLKNLLLDAETFQPYILEPAKSAFVEVLVQNGNSRAAAEEIAERWAGAAASKTAIANAQRALREDECALVRHKRSMVQFCVATRLRFCHVLTTTLLAMQFKHAGKASVNKTVSEVIADGYEFACTPDFHRTNMRGSAGVAETIHRFLLWAGLYDQIDQSFDRSLFEGMVPQENSGTNIMDTSPPWNSIQVVANALAKRILLTRRLQSLSLQLPNL